MKRVVRSLEGSGVLESSGGSRVVVVEGSRTPKG